MFPPPINSHWIVGHSNLIHELASRVKQPGKLVMTGFGENPSGVDPNTGTLGLRLAPKVFHTDIGDRKLMVKRAQEIAHLPHYNVYMPLAVFRPDLPSGAKGSEADIVACFGLVADFDDEEAANWADRLPVPPHYVLETSKGRFQAFYFFKDPVSVAAVKPVAERLKAYARCDHGTSDISHVWRIPGTPNWPNAKKVAQGRPAEPQLVTVVRPYQGGAISLEKLSSVLPEIGHATASKDGSPHTKSRARKGQNHKAAVEGTLEWHEAQVLMLLFLPEDLQEEIRGAVDGDRSKALYRVIAKLIELGLEDASIKNLIHAHPNGIGEKYADRDDLDKEIARIRRKLTDPLSGLIDEMNEHYAVVDDNGTTCVVYRRYDDALNRDYVVKSSFHDFRNLYLNQHVTITDAKGRPKSRTYADVWLSHPDRRTYKSGLKFLPGVSESPDGVYNLWGGWSVDPLPGDWSLMKAHIRDVICSGNEQHYEYLFNWLARAVQQPGVQGEVAVVLRGERGTGKGAFARAFGLLFGQHFLHLSDARHLTGNFNAHLRDACVVFADEAFYAGDKQHEGQLKRIVTEPTLMIEPKYRDAAPARNCLHVIVSSNEEWVVPAGADERRFFVLDVSQCKQKNFPYFAALEAELRHGGAAAMLYDLQRRDLTNFNVRDVPSTLALLDQKAQSFRGPEAWWYETLVDGVPPVEVLDPDVSLLDRDWTPPTQDWEQPIRVGRDGLYADYLDFSKRTREYRPTPKSQFGKALRKFVPALAEERPRQGAGRSRLYVIPPLAECRASFEKLIGGSLAWEHG